MNIAINNNNGLSIGGFGDLGMNGVEKPVKETAVQHMDLSITEGSALAEDIAVRDISDAEFVRDDALGKMVAAAFNLPAPPMPNFV